MTLKKGIYRGILPPLFSVIFIFSLPGDVWGHRVHVLARVEGTEVSVEGYYGDGTKAANARVEVFDSKGEIALHGVTDPEGSLQFQVPFIDDFRVVLTDGMGHKSSFLISKRELEKAGGGGAPEHFHPVAGGKGDGTHELDSSRARPVQGAAELERLMDRKLEPIARALTDIQRKMDRPALRDVFGGLGYIVGIAGLLFFITGRRKRGG